MPQPERRSSLTQQRPPPPTAPQRRPSQTPPGDEITQRTLVSAVVLTAMVTALISAFVFAVVLERGREGPRGPAGVAGPSGAEGKAGERGRTSTQLSVQALVDAIEEDPGRVSDAIADAQGLDPALDDPGDDSLSADVEQEVLDLRDEFQALCDALRTSGDASSDELPC